MNLPNAITAARIAACPLIFYLALSRTPGPGYAAFVLFLLAAFSDLWDGHLARKHGLVTNVGKLLDPVADKLLLASTFVPFYIVGARADSIEVPVWGALPLWVLAVVFGREALVTLFRGWAARRGVVISAGEPGKYKALTQNLFIGGLLLWYPLAGSAAASQWSGVPWDAWRAIHAGWIAVTLPVAVLLTVYSMLDYFWRHRSVVVAGGG